MALCNKILNLAKVEYGDFCIKKFTILETIWVLGLKNSLIKKIQKKVGKTSNCFSDLSRIYSKHQRLNTTLNIFTGFQIENVNHLKIIRNETIWFQFLSKNGYFH